MDSDDTTVLGLKTELKQRVEELGLQRAKFPSDGEPIDTIVQQLESMNPIPQPLHPKHRPTLFGEWRLIYASRGTVVTRQLAQIPDFWGGIKIKRVWQRLVTGDDGKILASNGALLDIPLLGESRLLADGIWTLGLDEKTALVKFNTFSGQLTKPFGSENWSLPELKIPVLEFLQNEALWITSYLDDEIRVGRGATGNLFVFCRE
jgi:hypothetical protein